MAERVQSPSPSKYPCRSHESNVHIEEWVLAPRADKQALLLNAIFQSSGNKFCADTFSIEKEKNKQHKIDLNTNRTTFVIIIFLICNRTLQR